MPRLGGHDTRLIVHRPDALSTLRRVASLTPSTPLSTREIVLADTPTLRATWLSVVFASIARNLQYYVFATHAMSTIIW